MRGGGRIFVASIQDELTSVMGNKVTKTVTDTRCSWLKPAAATTVSVILCFVGTTNLDIEIWRHVIAYEVVGNTKGKDWSEKTEDLSAAEGQEISDCRGTRNIKEYSKYWCDNPAKLYSPCGIQYFILYSCRFNKIFVYSSYHFFKKFIKFHTSFAASKSSRDI